MWTHRWQSVSYYILRSTRPGPQSAPQEGRTLARRGLQDVARATHRKGLDIDSCRRRRRRRRRLRRRRRHRRRRLIRRSLRPPVLKQRAQTDKSR